MSFDQVKVNAAILEHGAIYRVVIAAVKGSAIDAIGALTNNVIDVKA